MSNSDSRVGFARASRTGFSLIELLVVIAIAALLVGVSVPAVTRAQARRQVVNARESFVWLAARARLAAVERGSVTRLELDPGTGLAQVILRLPSATDTILEAVRYGEEYRVGVQTTSGGAIRVCYESRGLAMEGACTMAGLPQMVTFSNATGGSAQARVLLLGQVERR